MTWVKARATFLSDVNAGTDDLRVSVPSWHDDARCRSLSEFPGPWGSSPDWVAADCHVRGGGVRVTRGGSRHKRPTDRHVLMAQQCQLCPVRADCLWDALTVPLVTPHGETGTWGVWAGTTHRMRQRTLERHPEGSPWWGALWRQTRVGRRWTQWKSASKDSET